MNPHVKRASVLLAGTLFAFLALELSLRALGFASALELRRAPGPGSAALVGTLTPPAPDPAAFRILCLGNSHTQGAGTEPYPRQLEKLLREKYPGRAFQVINAGRGNWNSAEVLENTPAFLAEYKPAVVFVMAGEPNFWNYRYFEKQLAGESRLLDRFRALKVVRLVDILLRFDSRHEPVPETPGRLPFPNQSWLEFPTLAMNWVAYLEAYPDLALVPSGDRANAERALEKWLAHPGSKESGRRAWTTLLELRLFRGDYAAAKPAAEMALAFGPYDLYLARALEKAPGKFPALEKELAAKLPTPATRGLLEKLLGGEEASTDLAFLHFAAEALPGHPLPLALLRKLDPASDPATLLERSWRQNPSRADFFSLLDPLPAAVKGRVMKVVFPPRFTSIEGGRENGEGRLVPVRGAVEEAELEGEREKLKRWVARDLARITEISRDYGAQVILQTYPPYRFSRRERWPDATIRAAALELHAPLTDVSKKFEALFAGGDPERFYRREGGIQDDNHLNSKGNGVIAELMLEELERQEWVKGAGSTR